VIVSYIYVNMTDNLSPVQKLKFDHKIRVVDHSPTFINKICIDKSQIELSLTISHDFYNELQKAKSAYPDMFLFLTVNYNLSS